LSERKIASKKGNAYARREKAEREFEHGEAEFGAIREREYFEFTDNSIEIKHIG